MLDKWITRDVPLVADVPAIGVVLVIRVVLASNAVGSNAIDGAPDTIGRSTHEGSAFTKSPQHAATLRKRRGWGWGCAAAARDKVLCLSANPGPLHEFSTQPSKSLGFELMSSFLEGTSMDVSGVSSTTGMCLYDVKPSPWLCRACGGLGRLMHCAVLRATVFVVL